VSNPSAKASNNFTPATACTSTRDLSGAYDREGAVHRTHTSRPFRRRLHSNRSPRSAFPMPRLTSRSRNRRATRRRRHHSLHVRNRRRRTAAVQFQGRAGLTVHRHRRPTDAGKKLVLEQGAQTNVLDHQTQSIWKNSGPHGGKA